jgi:formyl-CoA transferase
MLLKDTRVVQLGCGVSGDIAGRLLTSLGVDVTKVTISPCPVCGDLCDESEPWRSDYSARKTRLTLTLDELPGHFDGEAGQQLDAALIDGVSGALLDSWSAIARRRQVPSFLFVTVSDGGSTDEIETSGLGAEAVAGVAGTMGPAHGPPTPLGYLFGETNAAVRGVAMLVDRLVRDVRHPRGWTEDEWLTEVSAADACIDAMDGPWQELSLPGSAHDAPNSLSNENYQRTGAQRATLVPYGLLEAGDGWVALVGVATTELLAKGLGRPELVDDERFATVEARTSNREFVVDMLQEWVGKFERGQDFVDLLGNSVVVAKSERLDEVIDDPHDLLGFGHPTTPYRITVDGVPLEDLDP